MKQNYATLAFTDMVKALQERYGSRTVYARLEQKKKVDGFTERETKFIQERDTCYLASIGQNGFPYVQHRGGLKGFLHVLDSQTLAFADYQGNGQYISVGNILTHPKVSLLVMDYARRTRLKLYATAEIVELTDRPDLLTQLTSADDRLISERMIVLHVEAFDWNCPQHITPRYSVDEINQVLQPLQEQIAHLEAQVALLRQKE